MEVLEAVEPEAIPVVVLEESKSVEHQCFAHVQVECVSQVLFKSRRRHKADQAVDPISLGGVLDSGEDEMSALMRFDLQPERRTRGPVRREITPPTHLRGPRYWRAKKG